MQDDPQRESGRATAKRGECLAMWSDILEITEQLQGMAQRGDWSSLDTLSRRRETLLREFFANPVPDDLRETIQRDIRRIQDMDADVVHQVQKSRAVLTDELTRLQAHKKRIRDYLSNSA